MSTTTDTSRRRPAFPAPGWWIRDRDGHVVLAQAPNAAILVWLTSVVVGWTDVLDHDRGEVLTDVGQGALVVWSLDELLRGASPVRRLMGAVVLPVMVWRILGQV
jgi:hypothetical protein